MMMSPLFKEETSFTIYMRANISILFKTRLFCSFKKRYCYNRDNRSAIFKIIQVTVSSSYCYYPQKVLTESQITHNGICVLDGCFSNWVSCFSNGTSCFSNGTSCFSNEVSCFSNGRSFPTRHITYLRSLTCVSNNALQLMIKYKSIVELNVRQIKHIIKKRFLYTLG